jgi:predicted anti-sigma-YlaC factor YlaD
MLTCKQITELVTDYLEGRLGFADRMRFQMHVGMCRHCRTYLKQMKATIAALGRLPEVSPMPEDVRDALRQRFADWHTNRARNGKT